MEPTGELAHVYCFTDSGAPLYIYEFKSLDGSDFFASEKKIGQKELQATVREAEEKMRKWCASNEDGLEFPPTWIRLVQDRFDMRRLKIKTWVHV